MPARVHAILVVRPDGRTPASLHLKRTLAALHAQSRPVDALTIVTCGEHELVSDRLASSAAEAVLHAAGSTSYAQAVRMASLRVPEGRAVWLLAQDTAPEPEALALLVGTLELSPSVAVAAPKLVRWDDRSEMVSLGVTMTRLGRTVVLAEGEFDQGQHDADEDALGADVRGILVRADAWRELGGLDTALAGADEGLDLGVRARLAGSRLALVPGSRVAVAGDGASGLPMPADGRRVRRIAYARRTAQLHRRFAYARWPVLLLAWLATLPLALLRSIGHLIAKAPGLIAPEWAASAVAVVRVGAIAGSRRRIAAARRTSWTQLAELRITGRELNRRLDTVDPDAGERRRGELRFFSGGGAWAVLAALIASVAVFTPLLAWSVLGGGGLLPLSDSVAALWRNAGWGLRATGVDVVGPADPFSVVLAVLGTVWPTQPSSALVLLWVLALPLAMLGGWFATTRLTDRSVLRITGGTAWALAPTFLAALTQGRPAAVIAHLLLPWLFYAASVAQRSWVAAASASLLLAAVMATAPSLAPSLAVLWLLAVVLAVTTHAGRGLVRLVWILVPAAVLAGPLVWRQVRDGNPLALLADPGSAWAGPQAAPDATGRLLLALGFPTGDLGGWATLLGTGSTTWWVPLLLVPLGVLALLAPLTRRGRGATVLLGTALLGIGTACVAVGISVGFAGAAAVALWPGPALSLAWLGVVGAAVTTLDAGIPARSALARPVAVTVLLAALVVVSVPALTAVHRGDALVEGGARSTLPAYVAAEGRTTPGIGTLVLTPLNGGGVSSRVIWGPSETLDGQATITSTRTEATTQDNELAAVTADLIASRTEDPVDALAADGVSFVLLAPAQRPESEKAHATRLQAVTSIDQRDQLVPVGETSRGTLWRMVDAVADRSVASATQRTISGWLAAAQLFVGAVAILLALPTAASRRAARQHPRALGRGREADR